MKYQIDYSVTHSGGKVSVKQASIEAASANDALVRLGQGYGEPTRFSIQVSSVTEVTE